MDCRQAAKATYLQSRAKGDPFKPRVSLYEAKYR